MAVSLKHAFSSGKADGVDATLVQPSNWNAEHTLQLDANRLLGRTSGGPGPVEEISVTGSGSAVLNNGPSITSASITSASITNASATNLTVTNYTETLYSANSSTSFTVSLANGTVYNIQLTGSPTITMPTAVAGKSFIMMLYQDATGGRTVTWSTVVWPGGTPPSISGGINKRDIFSFFSDGTNWYGTTIGQNY
jgi:hypothetical protein